MVSKLERQKMLRTRSIEAAKLFSEMHNMPFGLSIVDEYYYIAPLWQLHSLACVVNDGRTNPYHLMLNINY